MPGVIGMPCPLCLKEAWGDDIDPSTGHSVLRSYEDFRDRCEVCAKHALIKDDGNYAIMPFRLAWLMQAHFMDHHNMDESHRWPLDDRSRPRGMTIQGFSDKCGIPIEHPTFRNFLNACNAWATVRLGNINVTEGYADT